MRTRHNLLRYGFCVGAAFTLGLAPAAWAEEAPAAPPAAPAPAAEPAPAPAAGGVDFATAVWPILESRCIKCHGAEKPKAKLQLDTPEHILKGSEDGPVLVAGKPDESSLLQRVILPAGDDDIMPPKGDPLTPEQTAVLRQWITEGASFGAWTGAEAVMADQVAAADAAVQAHEADGPVKSTFEARLEKLAEGVTPAPEEALAPLRDLGALVMPLDQKTPLLRVSLQLLGDKAGDEQLALLAPLKEQITWLNLGGTAITDAGIAQLAGFPRLTMLHLERTGVGDAGVAQLAPLSHLEYLNLYATKVTDAGLAPLAGLPELHKLYLWQSAVTEEGAAKLASAKPGLIVDTGAKLAEPPPAPEAAPEAMPAPAEAPAAAPAEAPAAAPAEAPAVDLAKFFDAGGCCATTHAGGKDCDHPCCVEARAKGEVCAKCNANGAKTLAMVKQFTPDSCCAKVFAEGKECDHPCCVEARAKGEVCAKCNA